MSNDEKKETGRNFYFSLAELIVNIERCERLCPIETIIEMCETMAGVMSELAKIYGDIQSIVNENDLREIKKKYNRTIVGERFYFMHIDAICDLLRLTKHLREVSQSKTQLITDVNQIEGLEDLPPLDIKHLISILEAIPRVKTLNDDI